MKAKTFIILLVFAGILAAVSLVMLRGEKEIKGNRSMGERLFAALPVNDIASVSIISPESTVNIVKGDKVWEVKERSGFPADFETLSDLILKISKLKIGRTFDASAETLKRMKLKSPEDADADTNEKGVKIIFKNKDEKEIESIILGSERQSKSGSRGQYLTTKGGNTVFLVDKSFRFMKKTPPEWLSKDILNIKAEAIESVSLFADTSDKPVYRLRRPEKSKAAKLSNIPDGRMASVSKIDQVFEAIGPLAISDVSSGSDKAGQKMRLEYQLYDGKVVTIYPVHKKTGDDAYSLQITVAFNPEYKPTTSAEADKGDKKETKDTSKTPETVKKEAEDLNNLLSDWTFSVEKWQFQSFITTVEGLLEEKKDKEKTASKS